MNQKGHDIEKTTYSLGTMLITTPYESCSLTSSQVCITHLTRKICRFWFSSLFTVFYVGVVMNTKVNESSYKSVWDKDDVDLMDLWLALSTVNGLWEVDQPRQGRFRTVGKLITHKTFVSPQIGHEKLWGLSIGCWNLDLKYLVQGINSKTRFHVIYDSPISPFTRASIAR